MTNRELYGIMERLGMVEEANGLTPEHFVEEVSTDLVSTIVFVDELTIYNDLETIKKLLVAIIYTNREVN